MDTYGHLIEGADKESAQAMDNVFGSRAGAGDLYILPAEEVAEAC